VLFNEDRIELAHVQADATLSAESGINPMRMSSLAEDRLLGALAPADSATAPSLYTDIGVDLVDIELSADTGRAFAGLDMREVFVPKMAESPQNRIGSQLSQAAQ